jgi:hypothetical protein
MPYFLCNHARLLLLPLLPLLLLLVVRCCSIPHLAAVRSDFVAVVIAC